MKSVEERKLPELDDEFCKAYGVEEGGIDRLRAEVEENMRRELADAIRAPPEEAGDGRRARREPDRAAEDAWSMRRCASCRSMRRVAWARRTPRRFRRPSASRMPRAAAWH